jgi:integrase
MSFREFIEYVYVPNLRRRQAKPSTLASYAPMLERHVYPQCAGEEIGSFTPARIEVLLGTMKRYSPKYQRNVALLLRAAFHHAVESGVLQSSPMRAYHIPRTEQKEKPSWTEEEIRSILEALPEEHRPVFSVAALTGMRVGEVLALTWGAVDFRKGWIEVKKSLWNGHAFTPKTEASKRVIPLGPELYVLLQNHKDKERELWGEAEDAWGRKVKTADLQDSDFVFRNRYGKPYSPDVLRRDILYPTLARLGMTWCSREVGFHRFRHSAGSIVVSKTGNLKVAQKLLGHSCISTTANIYTNVRNEELVKAVEALESSLLGAPQEEHSPKDVGQNPPPAADDSRRSLVRLVAGACYVAIHNALSTRLSRRWPLPRNGRRLKRT